MDEEDLRRIAGMAFINRARIDVLEAAFAHLACVCGQGPYIDELLRKAGEHQLRPPSVDDRTRANAEASIRLADVVATAIATHHRNQRPGS